MGFGLIDMGNSPPWTLTLSCGYLSPKSLSMSVCSWQYISFIICQFTSLTYYTALAPDHMLYLQYTSLGSQPCNTSTIHIASLGFENEDVTNNILIDNGIASNNLPLGLASKYHSVMLDK